MARILPPRRRSLAAICMATILLAMTPGAGSAAARKAKPQRVPQGFAGVVIDGPIWPVSPEVNLDHQLDVMVADGVESIRPQFDWASTQPYQSWSDVPADQLSQFTDVDGMPLRLGPIDQLVAACAARGLIVRPVVLDAPSWDAAPAAPGYPPAALTPASYAPYARFMAALVHRYGPRGSFWNQHRAKLPIRMWQIWNEPNIPQFWAIQPNFAPSYVQLLRAAHDAIKSADPGAKVIMAGMVNGSWTSIAQIYNVPGAHRYFDIVAAHPYTHYPAGVLTILDRVRGVMDSGGDRGKPILADEVGWNSSLGKSPQSFGVEVTEAVQASNLGTLMSLLAKARSRLTLLGFDWYDWAGIEDQGGFEFDFAGLFRLDGAQFIAKPVLAVFRRDALAQERCRQKSSVATRCRRPA